MVDFHDWLIEDLTDPVKAVEFYFTCHEIFLEDNDLETYVGVLDKIIEAQNKTSNINLIISFHIAKMLANLQHNKLDAVMSELPELQSLAVNQSIEIVTPYLSEFKKGQFAAV